MTASNEYRSLRQGDEISGDILVIGDDPVSGSVVFQLPRSQEVIFVKEDDRLVEFADKRATETIVVRSVIDFIRETTIRCRSAIVATSRDSQNLLVAQHLRLGFGLELIVVRVNDPQNLDAFGDLMVETIDVADIVGSALVRQLEQPRDHS